MNKKRRTVLVVEDSPVQAASIGQVLEQEGLNVLYALDGRIGVHMAQRHKPDAIVLDLQMPAMDGFEVCKCLKDDDQTAGIPIVILTAHADRVTTVVKGIDLGAVDFIPKDGFADTVLVETLRQLHILEDI